MMTTPRLSRFALLLSLASPALLPQVPARVAPATAGAARVDLPDLSRAVLLAPGKTQGAFHLNGVVRKDKTIVLRWANTHGEMPIEGVTVYRQKVGDRETSWKALNSDPVGFFRGPKVKDRLKHMRPEAKEGLLSLFHSDLQHDPVTKRRMTDQPAGDAKRVEDLTPDKVQAQYRTLRNGGRLAQADMQMLHAHADADPEAADLFGLSYTDKPGSGKWRYKIVVKLAEGGSVEATCAKDFDPSMPTPVPSALNPSAKSGNGKVLLNWEAPASDVIAGYNVYRADTAAGPWKRLNVSPVKLVKLETEDPEASMRRVVTEDAALEKELRKRAGQPLTGGATTQLRTQALESAEGGRAASLSPALTTSIKESQARTGGLHLPISTFTDDRRSAGNGDLVDEHTYLYRITTVDIGGGETDPTTAPTLTGTPKDLEPPKVPGQPRLEAHATALAKLRTAQSTRVKDARLRDLEQTIQSKQPQQERALTPFLLSGVEVLPAASKPAPAAPNAELGALSLGEAKRQRLSRLVATMPTKELAETAEASLLHSKADGTAPAAAMVWEASPDGDLQTYEVWRATGKGPFQKMASTPTPAWTDTGLEVGQAYRYVISAVDKLGNESGRSDEGLVEVSDSRLKEKLALKKVDGKATTALLTGVPVRELTRPKGWVMKAAGRELLSTHSAVLKVPAAGKTATLGHYQPAKSTKAPSIARTKGLAASMPAASEKGLFATAKVDPTTLAAMPAVTATFKMRAPSLNLMLVEPIHPKDIYVQLEWDRPLDGMPLEYVIYEAPQKIELKYSPSAATRTVQGMGFTAKAPSSATLTMAGAPSGSRPAAATPTQAVVPGTMATERSVSTSEAMHLSASKGIVANSSGLGLRESASHKGHMVQSIISMGPGEFTRVNEAPVTGERFALTFPAEVGQYGGATFYFRVQARTKEFGRTIEGPMSEVIEVKLPDVVPPPPPTAGSVDLAEITDESFRVALAWTHVPAKDLAGFFVDRQTFDYTLVNGVPQPANPLGDPQRITPSPVAGDAYSETNAPGGYQRYTIRAVDKTGNVSDPNGYLDIFVPGEPVPSAPTGLALAGGRLTWKAAKFASGYSVWRSFSGLDEDFEQISGLLGANETGFNLPTQGTLHLKVVARSTTGMHQTASEAILRSAALNPGL